MSIKSKWRTQGNGDEHIVDYLKRKQAEDPSFFYAVEGDSDQSSGNIFWVDSTFRMNYNYFGDTARLDTSYKAHHPMLPLVSITGLNHHGQPILFGCGLLHYESESGYTWLLQNWLHAMSGNYPISITTEPDHRISIAVAQVLPQTCHRFCRWSIFRETRDKLNPTFDNEFRKFIQTATINEFESCWQALLERHSVEDNDWLQSIYNARHQWVPVYMPDTFFGELYPEENISFFHGYVNATTSMESLVKQYESAVTSWHEMEVKADLETANTMPVLKTPSPMEKQAASVYTRRAFLRFQEELVETLVNVATKVEEEDDSGSVVTYHVAKFEEQKTHVVRLNRFEMKAVCSCHMFEFSGIICGHCLSVFRAENVLTLPSQYILKRWSRDARRVGSEHDSRYNSLRKEVLKFVEEGAKSVHVYNVAQDALRLAAHKVDASKLLNQQIRLYGGSPYHSESEDEKGKKIRELTSELEKTNERCEVYRANLLAVLREMEEQKLKLSVKVQNARLTLKE